MQNLATLLTSYDRYHRDACNRRTHYVGVPLISYAVLTVLALTGWHLPTLQVTFDRIALIVLALLYLSWDLALGLMLTVLLIALAALAEWTVRLGTHLALIVAAAAFVIGWALQLLGHRFEGNRPALLDNLLQILVAPMYLTAELAFAFGWCARLRTAMQRSGRH